MGYFAFGQCKDTLRLGTAGILGGWALQGCLVVGRCRGAWWLGTAGILCGWALRGYFAVGHCKILCGWAVQGYLVVGHCRDTLRLGTSVKHCRDTWWLSTAGILGGWSLRAASSRARTTSTVESNNPTARVGKNQIICLTFLFK